jgi:hypothetical protein
MKATKTDALLDKCGTAFEAYAEKLEACHEAEQNEETEDIRLAARQAAA